MLTTAKENFQKLVSDYGKKEHKTIEVPHSEMVDDKRLSEMNVGDYVLVPDVGQDFCDGYYVEKLDDKTVVAVPLWYKVNDSELGYDEEIYIAAEVQRKDPSKPRLHNHYMTSNYFFIGFPTTDWNELTSLTKELIEAGDVAPYTSYLNYGVSEGGRKDQKVDFTAKSFIAHSLDAANYDNLAIYNGFNHCGYLKHGETNLVV